MKASSTAWRTSASALGRVEGHERGTRLLLVEGAQVAHRGEAKAGVLLGLRRVDEGAAGVGGHEGVEDLAAQLGGGLGLVELLELGHGAHGSQQVDGLAAQLGRLLGARRLEDPGLVVGHQEGLEDLPAQADVGRGVDLAQHLEARGIARHAEVLHRPRLEVGALGAPGDAEEDLAGARASRSG